MRRETTRGSSVRAAYDRRSLVALVALVQAHCLFVFYSLSTPLGVHYRSRSGPPLLLVGTLPGAPIAHLAPPLPLSSAQPGRRGGPPSARVVLQHPPPAWAT